jgi:lysozyme
MTILGIDISKWDGNWDANKAKQAGASFVFVKASQATSVDPQFSANWQKAKDAGLLRGAYHYLDYTKPGADQANFFADLLKNDPGELPPVVDYELRRTDNNPSAALGFLRDYLDRMILRSEVFQDMLVKRPMIYTSPGFWVEYGDQTKTDYWIQFPLWNAHWTTSSTPLIPLPWTMWQFWQFSAKGPGDAFGSEDIVMDMNRFNGTSNELMEFCGIRIPVVNLNEKFEALDDKVTRLASDVSSINLTGNTSASDVITRVDHLETQFTNLNGSISALTASLSQRLAAVEQKMGDPATTPVVTPIPPVTPDPVPDPVPGPVVTPDPSPTVIVYATCNTSALNVRNGPGPSYAIVAGMQYGQRVRVISRQNGWAQFENPSGWSNETYLTFEQTDPTVPGPSTPIPASTATYGIVNTSGLNVRNGPGVAYPIVGGLTYGQRILILSHQTGWAQISSPSGWCNESYLSFA